MKKLVNSKVINIENIELFELAAEGLALQSVAISSTADGVEGNVFNELIRKYIKQYDIFFKSMPYPLYAIEADIKYATLGNFIKILSSNKENINMWVNRGLYIKIDESTGSTLKIVNNTWAIVYTKQDKENNTDMSLFKECTGYNEYMWLLEKILNKQTTANFYSEFMPEFVEACNNQELVLKWELENILTFGKVPSKLDLKQNKILNTQANEEYILDIYCTGTINTDEKIQSWALYEDDSISNTRYKQMKTYEFDMYSKPILDSSKTSGKLEKCKIIGMHNLFMQLCGIKNAGDRTTFPDFVGIISDSNFVFTIEKQLFIAKSNRLVEPKDIAHGVELYNVENNKVYFIKSKQINDQISKDVLYSYNIIDSKIRLCKIIFTY